ncbi:MAG TPA: hypothetical protein VEL47_05480 [Myxococcota bacterium]|nr:hypothetical protein [Myxococcota bacterium]
MYRTNFYGQSATPSYFTRSSWPLVDNFPYALSPPLPNFQESMRADSYSAQPLTPFEQRLKQKMDLIRRQEEALKQKMSALKKDKIDPQIRQEILTSHSLIERSKKLIALIVEQMQKSLHNITANFH